MEFQFPSYQKAVALCGQLSSSERFQRKQALNDLVAALRYDAIVSVINFQPFFLTHASILLNTLRDPCEVVREAGIACIRTFVAELLRPDGAILMCVMPVLVERIGTPEMVEKSEECRHLLLDLVHYLLLNYQRAHMEISFLQFVTILRITVKDKCPSLKCLSCKCIILLARALPVYFRNQAGSMVEAVLTTFKHGQEKVRRNGVNCLGEVLLHCDCESLAKGVTCLTERVLDYQPAVRSSVIRVTAGLLKNYRDRYSCFHRLLPIILTGLNDEVTEIKAEARKLWDEIGVQYLQENEDRLKDQKDYLIGDLPNYPADLVRPNLGCRALVQNNISKYVGVLASELKSWQSNVRMHCSNLLLATILHVEDEIIQHLPRLLDGINVAILDDEVAPIIMHAVEMIGYFIPIKSWADIILPVMGTTLHRGNLRVLACFTRGISREVIDSKTMSRILRILAEKENLSRKTKFQMDFAECLLALQVHYTVDMPSKIAQYLFNIHMTFMSIKNDDTTATLGDLHEALHAASLDDVWEEHLPALLDSVDNNPRAWEQHTIEHCIFRFILLNPRPALGLNLSKVKEILLEAMHDDSDAQTRLTLFHALSVAFASDLIQFASVYPKYDHLSDLIQTIITPALVWKAGKENDSVRTMAVTCLASAIGREDELKQVPKDILESMFDKLLPVLLSLSTDQRLRTRRTVLEILCIIKRHMLRTKIWTISHLIDIYPKVLKRFDDDTNEIHALAVHTLEEILKSPPDEFRLKLYQAHHELIIDALFIHFDDSNEHCRESIKGSIWTMKQINGKLTLAKSNYYLPFVKNKDDCVEIINDLDAKGFD